MACLPLREVDRSDMAVRCQHRSERLVALPWWLGLVMERITMSCQVSKRTLEMDDYYNREVSNRGGKSGVLSAAGEANVVCSDATSDTSSLKFTVFS